MGIFKWVVSLAYHTVNTFESFNDECVIVKEAQDTYLLSQGAKLIAPDKAAYCVFTQFRGPENAIKFISVRIKTQ